MSEKNDLKTRGTNTVVVLTPRSEGVCFRGLRVPLDARG